MWSALSIGGFFSGIVDDLLLSHDRYLAIAYANPATAG